MPAHVFAFSWIARPVLQYGLDLLRDAWNHHRRANARGVPGSGGVPEERAAERPHPGGQLQLPEDFDGIAEYFEAYEQQPPVQRDDRRDPLRGRPGRQQRRHDRVVSVLGRRASVVWMDIVGGVYGRFIDAYLEFLDCSYA